MKPTMAAKKRTALKRFEWLLPYANSSPMTCLTQQSLGEGSESADHVNMFMLSHMCLHKHAALNDPAGERRCSLHG